MKHTEQCKADSARYAEELAAYEKQWPDYCRTCQGWGMLVSPGCSVPYGATSVNLPDEEEPCPKCADEGKCPRCGAKALNADGSRCFACGWDFDEDGGIPDELECFCYLLEEAEE